MTTPNDPSQPAPHPPHAEFVPTSYNELTWQQRLDHIVETMREVSRISDPQEMVKAYAKRMRGTITRGHTIAVSRRDLEYPYYRVTRSTRWSSQPDPWKERDKLPLHKGGLIAELIYADQARIITPLTVPTSDPAHEELSHARSLIAVPHFEDGVGLNMVLLTSYDEHPIDPERLPDLVLQSNLFGRGTKNLVLSRELREAYDAIDRELRTVQDMQLSLLPRETPSLDTLDLATHYQTSTRAGGDYYDFFRLPDNRPGILVGDVSGHGTPAAVLMAIVHAVAHLTPGDPWPPDTVMHFVNERLCSLYTRDSGNFVTMLYGVYDETSRTLTYANAGHPDVLVRRTNGTVEELSHPGAGLPLGIMPDVEYTPHTVRFAPGEAFAIYTDGIPEAFNSEKVMYGDERMRRAMSTACPCADEIVSAIVQDLGRFAGLASRSDDRTLVVGSLKS